MKFRATKIALILSTLCLQVATTPALQAATLDDASPAAYNSQVRTGAFAGARIRLAVGSQTREPRLRAGFSFAAMQSGQTRRGASFTRFGEGLEFGVNSRNSQPHMSLAGYSLTSERLGAADGVNAAGKKKGLSTPATIGIVIGGAALLALLAFVAICADDGGECGSQ